MRRETKRILFQVGLFVITFFTTTLAGTEWAYGKTIWTPGYSWTDFSHGLAFSIPLLLILTVHEFGHYFMAMYHKVKTSFPYYIPIPPIPFLPFSIGTMGAVIRLRSRPKSNVENFDIGLAGPLAGFLVALVILVYAFRTLPPADHIFQFHPEYAQYGSNYADHVYTKKFYDQQRHVIAQELKKDEKYKDVKEENIQGLIDVRIGTNLVFWIFQHFATDPSRVPNPHEMMHYPMLLACYIALFVTCLNLLPIGQLDGGHVSYGLFGYKIHKMIATIFFITLIFYAGLGLPYMHPSLPFESRIWGMAGYLLFLFISFKGLGLSQKNTIMIAFLMFTTQFLLIEFFPDVHGYSGWLLFGLVLGRFIGVAHPPSEIEQNLDSRRILLGWITLLVFALCFSPAPIEIG
jgi:membrane-associated protease RseP (regulator of RpoE activity)